jgi:IS30 family transposase
MIPVVGKALLQNSPRNVPEFLNRLPDANEQERMRQAQTSEQNYEAVNAARKKQVSEESTKLLKLAIDLKAEVDKTGKDTLSLSAIRKADSIERMARDIREKMTAGGPDLRAPH